MILKVTQSHQNYRYLISHTSVVYSNKVSVLRRFRDTAVFTVYMTACHLQKSFSFDNIRYDTIRYDAIYIYVRSKADGMASLI